MNRPHAGIFFFLFSFVVTINSYGQSQLRVDPPVVDSFPVVKGTFWSRSYGAAALSKENLTITENGTEVAYQLKAVADTAPLPKNKRVLILVENQGSSALGSDMRKFYADVIGKGVASCVNPGDQVALYSFDLDRNGRFIFCETAGYTSDTARITRALQNMKSQGPSDAGGKSDIYRSLDCAMDSVVKDDMPTAIFLFSDGNERNKYPFDAATLCGRATKFKVPVYTITYDSKVGTAYSEYIGKNICVPSYGGYLAETNDASLARLYFISTMNAIIANSRGTNYEYSYTSTQNKEGQVLSLEFTAKGVPTEKVPFSVPDPDLSEWISYHKPLAGGIGAGVLAGVVLLFVFVRRNKKNRIQQEKELSTTKEELRRQAEKSEQEKMATEASLKRMQEEQSLKERRAAEEKARETREAEEQRLQRLMEMKGAFPKLNYVWNDSSGEIIITKPVFSLGREQTNDFYMQLDTVSRKHATIYFEPDGSYRIADNQSSNGTFLNGSRITESPLKGGDLIEIGGISITFQN